MKPDSSQMPWRIHAVMKNANDDDSVPRNPKVNHVTLHDLPAIASADVIACWCSLWRLGQHIKRCRQKINITIGLHNTPLLCRVRPDSFKILLCSWSETILSHGLQAFFA